LSRAARSENGLRQLEQVHLTRSVMKISGQGVAVSGWSS
jgi:hypothetical protein